MTRMTVLLAALLAACSSAPEAPRHAAPDALNVEGLYGQCDASVYGGVLECQDLKAAVEAELPSLAADYGIDVEAFHGGPHAECDPSDEAYDPGICQVMSVYPLTCLITNNGEGSHNDTCSFACTRKGYAYNEALADLCGRLGGVCRSVPMYDEAYCLARE